MSTAPAAAAGMSLCLKGVCNTHSHTVAAPIYLDVNGTSPVDPRVADAALPFLREHFGNPSSSHYFGSAPHAALTSARASLSNLLGARPEEVTFTSCSTESINWAIKGTRTGLERVVRVCVSPRGACEFVRVLLYGVQMLASDVFALHLVSLLQAAWSPVLTVKV